MRDRREALKLLAGGTAAALGTSIITTSVVHADGGTVSCQPVDLPSIPLPGAPSVALTRDTTDIPRANTTAATITLPSITIGAATCNTTFKGAPTAISQYTWTGSGPQFAGFGFYRTIDDAPITSFLNASAVPTTVRIRRTNDTTFQTTNANTPGSITFTATLTIRWLCRYGTSAANFTYGWKCVAFNTTFTWNNNGNGNGGADTASVSAFTPTPQGACNSDNLPEAE